MAATPTVTCKQALSWATVEGARALGVADRVGRIEPGMQADVVAIDARALNLWPVHDPVATIGELARVLKPGAPMASLDFAVPTNPLWRWSWWCYTRMLLPVGGLLGGTDWVRVGRFLGPNITSFYERHPVSTIVAAWENAGMADVGSRAMSLGGGLVMWGSKANGRGP